MTLKMLLQPNQNKSFQRSVVTLRRCYTRQFSCNLCRNFVAIQVVRIVFFTFAKMSMSRNLFAAATAAKRRSWFYFVQW